MISALQPQRPKPLQQHAQPTLAYQQTRPVHSAPHPPPQTRTHPPQLPPIRRPRSQVEAMPPFGPTSQLGPPRAFYDSAVRHPVFFTEQLRKSPFPMPAMAAHGWNPVASGYVFERQRAEAHAAARTKL